MQKLYSFKQVLNVYSLNLCYSLVGLSVRFINMDSDITNEQQIFLDKFSETIPSMKPNLMKGDCGKIGVIGGSKEYTGAPYFAAISALKAGADLAHVFCTSAAAPVIKNYSPELIVHPDLDDDDASNIIEPMLTYLDCVVIGPGLGRNEKIIDTVISIISYCIKHHKPMVIDADGLYIIAHNPELIKGYDRVILTPNAREFTRLFGTGGEVNDSIKRLGVSVLQKSINDQIYAYGTIFSCPSGGSGRRCGGQGDVLAGLLATFYSWTLKSNVEKPIILAGLAASVLTKSCNYITFNKLGRQMLTSDMIEVIGSTFSKVFDLSKSH